jgi:predicted AAA+ superfamily ATPase
MELKRYLDAGVKDLCFADHKMAFLSGPRQCGKTTFAKMSLKERGSAGYFNWDDIEFRRLWATHPGETLTLKKNLSTRIPLIAYDEIHKARGWKRTLKGIYDTRMNNEDIMVTGSARMNVFMKGGDSLVGRYYHFRMHPFSVGELVNRTPLDPDGVIQGLLDRSLERRKEHRECFQTMIRFGAFPEPFLEQNERKARLWRSTRIERVIREDLRDMSRIPELSRIEMLSSLIPERVGSPLSVSSLKEDLEVSHDSVRRWLNYLTALYYVFEIRPYFRSVARSLRKEPKIYLWDFSEVNEPGPRFENFIASHLLKSCDFWTDTGIGTFNLNYLRNKEKQEIDFLITKDHKPWLAVEAKLSDSNPSGHWERFLHDTACPCGLQIVSTPGVWKKTSTKSGAHLIVASVEEVMLYFV